MRCSTRAACAPFPIGCCDCADASLLTGGAAVARRISGSRSADTGCTAAGTLLLCTSGSGRLTLLAEESANGLHAKQSPCIACHAFTIEAGGTFHAYVLLMCAGSVPKALNGVPVIACP